LIFLIFSQGYLWAKSKGHRSDAAGV